MAHFYTSPVHPHLLYHHLVFCCHCQGLQHVICSAENVIGYNLSCLRDLYTSRILRRVRKIAADFFHHKNKLFESFSLQGGSCGLSSPQPQAPKNCRWPHHHHRPSCHPIDTTCYIDLKSWHLSPFVALTSFWGFFWAAALAKWVNRAPHTIWPVCSDLCSSPPASPLSCLPLKQK